MNKKRILISFIYLFSTLTSAFGVKNHKKKSHEAQINLGHSNQKIKAIIVENQLIEDELTSSSLVTGPNEIREELVKTQSYSVTHDKIQEALYKLNQAFTRLNDIEDINKEQDLFFTKVFLFPDQIIKFADDFIDQPNFTFYDVLNVVKTRTNVIMSVRDYPHLKTLNFDLLKEALANKHNANQLIEVDGAVDNNPQLSEKDEVGLDTKVEKMESGVIKTPAVRPSSIKNVNTSSCNNQMNRNSVMEKITQRKNITRSWIKDIRKDINKLENDYVITRSIAKKLEQIKELTDMRVEQKNVKSSSHRDDRSTN